MVTLEEIQKSAYNDREMNDFGDLSDLHLHDSLRMLYADYRAGKISKEDAEELKKRMVAAWKSDKETAENAERMYREYQEAIRKTSGMNPEKAETPLACIVILAQMLAALTGDSSLPGRLKKQFEE